MSQNGWYDGSPLQNKNKNAFLSLRAMQKYLALVEMLSPVLLGHKRKRGSLDSDHKLHFSIILCTS